MSDPKLRLGAPNERRYLDRGNCTQDRRHNFNSSTVYETPQFSNGVVRKIATGWRISGIVRLLSGGFLTVAPGQDRALATGPQRADPADAECLRSRQSLQQLSESRSFRATGNRHVWKFRSLSILGPGAIRLDMGLTRSFQIREGQSVEFRVEAFNLPNHLNPGNPNTTLIE